MTDNFLGQMKFRAKFGLDIFGLIFQTPKKNFSFSQFWQNPKNSKVPNFDTRTKSTQVNAKKDNCGPMLTQKNHFT